VLLAARYYYFYLFSLNGDCNLVQNRSNRCQCRWFIIAFVSYTSYTYLRPSTWHSDNDKDPLETESFAFDDESAASVLRIIYKIFFGISAYIFNTLSKSASLQLH